MQNLYKYTRYFALSEKYDHRFFDKFQNALNKHLEQIRKTPPERSHVEYQPWLIPEDTPYHKRYYNIIYNIAKLCKVKIMWRLVYNQDMDNIYDVRKGFWIIGEESRIVICFIILSYYFRGLLGYRNLVLKTKRKDAKKAGFYNTKQYASYLIDSKLITTALYINKLLETDISHELWLEDYIKVQFHLNYKKYNTDKPEYYHAISKRFHHKRMML